MVIQQQPSSLSDRPQVSSMVKSRRSVSPAEPPYRLAQALVEQEKWQEAIAAYQRTLTIAPTWVEVQRELGDLFLKLERWDEAVQVYEIAIGLRSEGAEVYHNLGDGLLKLQRWEDAIAAYEKAIELNPEFSWSYNNLGDGLRELQRWDEAAQAYRKAIELKPDFALSHHNLGDVLVKKEDWENAIAAYQKAIDLDPNFVWSYYNLGESFTQLEQWEDGIKSYRKAIELQADLPRGDEKLADALQQYIQHISEEALNFYHQAIKKNKDDIELYHKSLEIQPDNPNLYLGLGNALVRQGLSDEAIIFYRIGLQLQPNHVQINQQLSKLLPDQTEFTSRSIYANSYEKWILENEPDSSELLKQKERSKQFDYRPLISIITPVYNTPPEILYRTIESVVEQTYDNWQLCLVDGNSSQEEVKTILTKWSLEDSRITVNFLDENLGISGNSNASLAIAKGQFIALLDHDDELAPFALFEVITCLNQDSDCDVIYSDEDNIDVEGNRSNPFFKPDWSPELLRSFMYTGHLTIYRHELVKKVGGFRSEFDFSQDYDLIWRITEISQKICHIPKILYHWRMIQGSASVGDKGFARVSNLAALKSAMKRQGYQAKILEYPTANRAKINFSKLPLVSIIIPTDNQKNLSECLKSLLDKTHYPQLEILIVTNSQLGNKVKKIYCTDERVKVIFFDEEFNFSAKCNRGGEKALGEYIIFFNDDVRPIAQDWIECMLEMMQYENVGGVSPLLMYENGCVQYGGMVTGVRGFVGTAFHQEPHDSSYYFNLLQSTRTVSVLSGACCMIRKSIFQVIGGWDAINTPIMGSDVDFSFKIRERGFRLVYTPFAKLTHIGHVSIDAMEKEENNASHSEKADLYLLKRWGEYLSYDPYYPDNMRYLIYHDSPTQYKLCATNNKEIKVSSHDILLVSHDLTWSGAPLMLHTLAKSFQENGYFVTVISPKYGILIQEYKKLNIPVIIDPLIFDSPQTLENFLGNYDLVIANTIVSYPLVLTSKRIGKPVIWLVHEGAFGQELAESSPAIQQAFAEADIVVFPSKQAEARYHKFAKKDNYLTIYYGIQVREIYSSNIQQCSSEKIRVIQVGSIEPRKGQDITIKAIQNLPQTLQNIFEFYFVGRILDQVYYDELIRRTADLKNVHWIGEVSPNDALKYISKSDIVICSSRDETGPIFVLEGMYFQKSIISTGVGVVPEIIEHGVNGLLFDIEDDKGLMNNLIYLHQNPFLFSQFGQLGYSKFQEIFTVEKYGKTFVNLIKKVILNYTEDSLKLEKECQTNQQVKLSKRKPRNKNDFYKKLQSFINDNPKEIQRLTEAYNALHEDRQKAQAIMDYQTEEIQRLTEAHNALDEDRQKAQAIMDYQTEEIQRLTEAYNALHEDRQKAQEIINYQDSEIQRLTAVYNHFSESSIE